MAYHEMTVDELVQVVYDQIEAVDEHMRGRYGERVIGPLFALDTKLYEKFGVLPPGHRSATVQA